MSSILITAERGEVTVARGLVLRELVDPVWPWFEARGFTRIPSGGYRLSGMPLHVFLERERWPSPGAELPKVDWRVFVGASGGTWAGGGVEPTILMLGALSEQRDPGAVRGQPPDWYPVDTEEQRAALVRDVEASLLPVVDSCARPEMLVRGLLDGTVAPFGGRRRNRLGAVDGALMIARAYGLAGIDDECRAVLAEEAAVSPTRDEHSRRIVARHGLDL